MPRFRDDTPREALAADIYAAAHGVTCDALDYDANGDQEGIARVLALLPALAASPLGGNDAQLRANLASMDQWLVTVDADRQRERAAWAEEKAELLASLDLVSKAAGPVPLERLADNIRQAIERSEREHQQVAAHVGIDPTALSKILTGKRRVSSLEVALLSEVTGVSVDRLLYEQTRP